MKGFVDHLITTTGELEREIEREQLNTEIPYLANTYKKWMLNVDQKSENVVNSYISYIKAIDREFFLYEDDFFYLLPEKIKAGKFDEVITLFEHYQAIIDEWLEDSKKEDVGISTKKISDWRSGFRNYRKFIVDWLIPEVKKLLNIKEKNADIKVPECKRLFAEEDFRSWLVDSCNLGRKSADSYISRLKKVNRIISQGFTKKVKAPADAFHYYIAKNLQDAKYSRVQDFLTQLINAFNQKIEQRDESLMPLDALRNCNSALRKYNKFILEECIVEVPDEEEEQEIEAADTTAITEITEGTDTNQTYDYEEIEENFQFRLFTQNRMSRNKDVFFPIGIIRRLFHKSEKASRVDGASNGYYKWLLKWAEDCIAEINILTDRGNTTLGMLTENAALILNPNTKDVAVNIMGNEKGAHLMTNTDKEEEAPVPMRVNKLNKIHIDHTPTMSQTLSDHISQLPALVQLTEIIRTTAKKHRLDITTKNFSKIGRKVINDTEKFAEMEKLIPALKQELELIRKVSSLQLMAAEYNLKKKK